MSKKKGWIVPAALGVLVLILILIFCLPVRQPKFFDGARHVAVSMSEWTIDYDTPKTLRTEAMMKAGDPAMDELTAIFRDYRLFRTFQFLDTLDGATTFTGNYDTPDFFIGVLTEGTTVHNIRLMSGYLHYENKLWRIGRNNSDWAELAQRLKDFVLEHSEDEITN